MRVEKKSWLSFFLLFFCRIENMDQKDEMILIQVRLLRLAAKTWHKEMPEVAKLFSQFKVYDFMQDMYEEFHVQGDSANLNEVEAYLRSQGVQL